MYNSLIFKYIFILPLVFSLFACEPQGKLKINLNLPDGNDYNPLYSSRISYFNMLLETPDGLVSRTAGKGESSLVKLGDIPTGKYYSISVSGNSTDGALIAYGINSNSGKIDSVNTTNVKINFRYPFTFIAGSEKIQFFHPFLNSDISFKSIGLTTYPSIVRGVATSPDGEYLITLVQRIQDGVIWLLALSTKNYKIVASMQINLPDMPDGIELSPSGNILGIPSYSGQYIAFVDLASFISTLNPEKSMYVLDLSTVGSPAQLLFLDEFSAVILSTNKFDYNTCDSPSQSKLTWVDIAEHISSSGGAAISKNVTTQYYTSHIAADPKTQIIYLANPCNSAISTAKKSGDSTTEILNNLNLSPCLVPNLLMTDESTLYVACMTEADTVTTLWSPAKLIIQKFSLNNTSDGNLIINLYPEEAIIYNNDNMPGGSSVIIMQEPSVILPKSIGLTVQSKKLILYGEAYYHGQDIPLGGASAFTEIKYKSYSVLFIDPISGDIDRRFRAACFPVEDITDQSMPQEGPYCRVLPNIEVPSVEFIPLQIANLYGR